MKWSDSRYVFDIQEDCNGKEAIQARRDRREAAPGRCSGLAGPDMVETQLLAPSILLPPCTAHVQMSGVRNSARAIRSNRPFRPSSSRKGGRVMARIRRSRKIFPTIFPSNQSFPSDFGALSFTRRNADATKWHLLLLSLDYTTIRLRSELAMWSR